MKLPGPGVRVLLAGAALMGLAWSVAPVASPPLYDGLTGSPEPYRYSSPPPGSASTQAPTSATTTLSVSGGTSQAGYLATTETPPQAQFIVAEGTFDVPAGAASISLSLKAVPPSVPVPASLGRVDGNVYEVTATANGAPVAIKATVSTPPTVVLRGPATNATGGTVVELVGSTWQPLHTVPIGSAVDTLAASVHQLGDFTVVLPANPTPGGGSGGGGGGGSFPVVTVVVPLVLLLLVGGVLVAVRSSSARRQAAARQRPRRRR